MKPWLNTCWQGTRLCGACALALARWTLWLALSLLLAFQVWIAASQELAVPGFVLRMFEARLAASHVQVKFGHAQFDPSGRILIDDLQLSLPAFAEPIAVIHASYIEFDPWLLLAGKFEPRSLNLSGTSFAIPAMLSRSGRSEDVLRDLDATFHLGENELVIGHLTARIAGIAVTARGSIHLTPQPAARVEPLPISDYLSAHYPDICRQLLRVADRLTALDQPELRLDLIPSNTRGAIATVNLAARGLKLTGPWPVQATGIRLTTRFPLQGDTPVMAPLNLTVDDLQFGGNVSVHALNARLRGPLHPEQYTYEPRELLLRADRVSARGFTFTQLSARVSSRGFIFTQPATKTLPRLQGELVAECAGLPLAVSGHADLAQQTAAFRLEGALSPALLDPIGAALHHDVRPYIGFGAPIQLGLDATFAPGWQFTRLTGRVRASRVDASHVPIDEGGGEIEFDGRHFLARHAFARLGENMARGSFEQDFSNLRFRFLLEGDLRPLEISGWFGKWWPAFFDDFAFPQVPPDASVDVAGQWKQGRLSTVFVYADSTAPVIHGVKFDHVRTLLFIRPNFFDGLELFATIGPGSARGTFTREIDPASYALVSMSLDIDSTLGLDVPGKIFGPAMTDQLAAFQFENPPVVKLSAHFDGPASPRGVHSAMRIEAQSTGGFAFNGFPLSNLSFRAVLQDDALTLDDVTVNFAGGTVTGKARVWGQEPDRRLGFDYALRDGSLGQAVRVLEEFAAKRKGLPPPPPGKFVQDKAGVKLELAASAEGRYSDPYSFKGDGHASLDGAALGEVRLLGLLSELLPFTSLRFTSAVANFKVDGPRLVFSAVSATGANSAIDAHGSYALDRHTLDFKARVNPFRESKFLPSVVIGAVLTPFANVLEVKLTGTLDKPSWSFVNGPTNFLRNLARPAANPAGSAAPPPDQPPDYLHR
jgi:hypothetical protein